MSSTKKMANDFISNYFGFNRQQRNGLFVLILMSFLLLVIRISFPFFIGSDKIVIKNLPLFERKLDSNRQTKKFNENNFHKLSENFKPFVFDPNTVSREQLLKLGFSEKKAITFLKFRDRGFIFKEKKDLKKVYGISDKLYERLEPYILIKPKTSKQTTIEIATDPLKAYQPSKKVISIVELNAADSVALEKLSGIGPAYAKRILKYRSMLGGFVSVQQLKEVYGLNEELFQKIQAFVSVDTSLIIKINLNKDDFKTVNKHPYLSYELTKTIFNQRRKAAITTEALKELINDEMLYQKLKPYLDID
jgi:competence ComEA-like helix-hairpin-helix protein